MGNLFQTISSAENLSETFSEMKDGAPGDDGMTKKEYAIGVDDRLRDLEQRLRAKTYTHGPVVRVHVPKDDGTTRPIGLARFEDKLVQRAMLRVLGPRIEARFAEPVFSRTGMGVGAARDYIYIELFETGFGHWLRLDVADCYGSLRLATLGEHLYVHVPDNDVLRLLAQVLRVRVLGDGHELPARVLGIEAGLPLSPLLANLYLHEALEIRLGAVLNDCVYARYLDDLLIGVPDEDMALYMHDRIRDGLRAAGLEPKQEKTQLVDLSTPNSSLTFLGVRFERLELAKGTAWRRDVA